MRVLVFVFVLFYYIEPTLFRILKKSVYVDVIASLGDVNVTLSVKVKNNVGINDVKGIDLVIYPNPAKTTLNIKGLTGISSFEIFNLLGIRVLAGSFGQANSINVSGLNSGVYLLKVKNGDNYMKANFIKH